MLPLHPLKLAPNVFPAETSEDLDAFYNFQENTNFNNSEEEESSYNQDIIPIQIERRDDESFVLSQLPDHISQIIISQSPDSIKNAEDNTLYIINSPDIANQPIAYYKLQSD